MLPNEKHCFLICVNMTLLVHMATFAAVVEKGSFTAAAESLGRSKSVVSKQITELEDRLGVRLLNRTTRRLHLTEAGELFRIHCERIVAEAREAELAVAPLQSEPRGGLRVTAPQSLALSLLPDALPRFQQRYPHVELELRISGRFVDLVAEGIDVALRIGELADSSLISRRLAPCRFMVCGSPHYWKVHGKPMQPTDLQTHNCLVYTETPRPEQWRFQDRAGQDLSVTVKGNLRSDDAKLLLSAAFAHQGVINGPSFLFEEPVTQEQLEPVLVDYYRTSSGLYAIYPYSKHVSSKVRALVDFLVEEWTDNTLHEHG